MSNIEENEIEIEELGEEEEVKEKPQDVPDSLKRIFK